MGVGEDEFLIPRRTEFGGAGSSHRMRQPQLGLRKLLQPLAIALGIFGVSAGAARYLFPRKKIQPQQQQQQMVQTAGRYGVMGGTSPPTTASCATSAEVVMKGVDLTNYFSQEYGTPAVFGVAEHEASYNGYRFWFASEENKAKFEEEPLAYIPSWGGFCSWGISRENWWNKDTLGPEADPDLWFITDAGRLHFFRSPTPMSKFLMDVPANTLAGDEVWSAWWGGVEPGASDVGPGSPLDTTCFCSAETCVDG